MQATPGATPTMGNTGTAAAYMTIQGTGAHNETLLGARTDVARTVELHTMAVDDSGVMQIVAVTDPMELGFARQAMIGLTVEGQLEPIADALAAMDEIEYVVITAGGFDILAEAVCESDEHLLSVLSSRIRAIPGVRGTETFVYLKLKKQTYSWGVR